MSDTKFAIKSAGGNLGRVVFLDGQGDLPMMEITTRWSTAEVYLHGAHVTHFQKKGEEPLLFLSQCSRFEAGQPIRGGIPIVFPWFGPKAGASQHGYARVRNWELKEIVTVPDGSVSVRLRLPDVPEAAGFPAHTLDYIVTVSDVLTLELRTTNRSADKVFTVEDCLHTYFNVGDIKDVSVHGLKGATYLDKVNDFASTVETSEQIRIGSEVDRTYLNTASPVEIRDEKLGRVIRVAKENSASTVVWNPWEEKAHQMADFGDDEYHRMVCVESGNVAANAVKLAPGGVSSLRVKLAAEPLARS
jgi:D-hexose-6-phosphate mutarotase